MSTVHLRTTRICHLLVASIALVLFSTACAHLCGPRGTADEQPSRPLLAAARAHKISLFGEIGRDDDVAYFTRAAVSLKRHTYTEVGGDNDPDIDAGGRRIAFSSTRHSLNPDIYIKSVDGVAVTQLTSDPASDVQPVFSPDGTRIAFASDRGGSWDIWVMEVDGGPPVRITEGPADEVHPTWSPDGSKLAYCSLPAQSGQWELWVTDVAMNSTKRFIGFGLFPEWSPQGDTILFQRARERDSRMFSIWTITLVDGEPRYPTEVASSPDEALTTPTWSPNAQQIAYTSIGGGPTDDRGRPSTDEKFDVWIMASDGRERVRLTDGHTANYAPVFSTSGRLFFTTKRSGHDNIWSVLPASYAWGAAGNSSLTSNPRSGQMVTEIIEPASSQAVAADAGY
ncbi:MAG: DPP IV N-terminal domain-containing protein [Planctomycetes bacterium]|nr:DPP IV N-terminal domain-containing protein [Planctomycetota bacterium]